MSEFSKNLAVIIGINDYQNGISTLKTAVPDAKKVCEILRLKHEYQTWILSDDLATLESITRLIEKTLPQQVSEGDRLIFYFAGHGIALNGEDGPEGYLIPQDAKLGNTDSYLPMTQLHSALSELPCRHFLGLLDCCFAGAFRWSSTRHIGVVPDVIHRERYDRFIADPAWQVITSAASDQKAADAFNFNTERGQKGDHSPFAAALIEALEGRADAYPPASDGKPPGDGIITATELYLYLRDAVEVPSENYSRQTPGIYPLKKHDKGEYIFLAPDHPLNLPPAPPLDVSKNPYRGLETFEEKHSKLFFGRTELTKKLFEFVNKNPLTVVLGASGSGKSSLVKAGLIPRLRKEESQRWKILSIRPGEAPFKALNNALKKAQFPELQGSSRWRDLVQSISSWAKTHPDSKLLLFIDQSEEIITLCKNEEERKAFFRQILAAINAHGGQLRVVLSLRSDFEPQVRDAGLKFLTADNQIGKTQLIKSWQNGRFIVPAMTRGELREAIEKPAEARVMYFQPHELVERLIDEVADMPGALPLLSFALSELYLKYLRRQREAENRGETIDRSLTQEDYENLGGVIQSLTQRADDEYEKLVQENPAYAKMIRYVMLRMVAVGEGELARRRVPLSELEYPPEKHDLVKTAIARFTEARLLVEGQDADGNPYVEPAHDALVRGWQKLLMWKQEDEEDLLLQRRLTPAAREWESQQKPRFLWNANPRLDLLKKVRKSDDNWLNKVEDEFVKRSVGRRSFNTRRNWGIAIAVMLGLGTGLVFSLIGQRNALIGQIRASRQAAEANFRSNQELDALADSLRAGKNLKDWPWFLSLPGFKPEPQLKKDVEATLRNMFLAVKERKRFKAPSGTVRKMFFTGDSQLVFLLRQQDKILLFNKGNGQISELKGQAGLYHGHFSISSDGNKIATATPDGKVRLWDLQGNKLAEFKAYQGMPKQNDSLIEEIKFVPDGNNIVTTGVDFTEENKILRIWNLEGKKLKETKIKGSKLRLWIGFNSQDELLIATLVEGNSGEIYVKVMDSSGRELARSDNIDTTAVNVNFSPDGKQVAIKYGGESENALLLDLERKESRENIDIIKGVRFHPQSGKPVTVGVDGTINFWNDSDIIFKVPNGTVKELIFTPDGNKIVTLGDDQIVRFWDLEAKPLSKLSFSNKSIVSVSFSPDSRTIATTGEEGIVRLWDLQDKKIRVKTEFLSDLPQFMSVSFSPDGQTIATTGEDGMVGFLNLQGNFISFQAYSDHRKDINWSQSVIWSPDGQTLATINSARTKATLWNLNGQELDQSSLDIAGVYEFQDLSFNSSGKLKVLKKVTDNQATGNINLSDFGDSLSTNIIPGRQFGNSFNRVQMSDDGEMLIATSYKNNTNTVSFWNLSGEKLMEFSSDRRERITNISPSPDKSKLAVIFENGDSELWNLGNLDELLDASCDRIRDYLHNNPNVAESDRTLCDP